MRSAEEDAVEQARVEEVALNAQLQALNQEEASRCDVGATAEDDYDLDAQLQALNQEEASLDAELDQVCK